MGVFLVVTRFRVANLTPEDFGFNWQPTRRSFGASARRRDNRLRIARLGPNCVAVAFALCSSCCELGRRKSLGHGTLGYFATLTCLMTS